MDSVIAGETVREQLRTDGQTGNGNYISMLSMGPFNQVEPGETISVYYAFSAALKPDEFQGISGKELDNEDSRVELTKTVNAINKVFQGEDKNNNGVLDEGEDTDGNGDLTAIATPPDNPKVKVQLETGKVTLYWDKTAERSRDRVSGEQDFEGYRGIARQSLRKTSIQSHDSLEEFNRPANAVGFNTGFDEVELSEPVRFEGDTITYYYAYELNNLLSGWQYQCQSQPSIRGALNLE